MSNAWPDGHRHAMSQREHAAWNADNWPGTRQVCHRCGNETGRCEEDQLTVDDQVVCLDRYHELEPE